MTDTGGHKNTGARTIITAGGGSSTTATGGVVTPAVPAPVGGKYTIRTASFSPDIPTSSLFTPRPEPTVPYLIETDPAFTDRNQWLSSDVQLRYMGVDPATAQKRVGDGFYEQMLVRDQLVKLTGYRYLSGYTNDLSQYAALLASGAVFGKQHNLIPGVALTAAQMAKLTSPMVWLVKRPVRLKDGSVHEVLVPQVYAVVGSGALRGDGALISGREVQVAISGTVVNQGGTIAGAERTGIHGGTVANVMGRIGDGGQTTLTAHQDMVNVGGTLHGGSVAVTAGRDFISQTTTQTNASESGKGSTVSRSRTTNLDRQASVIATDKEGSLRITSGRDIRLTGSGIHNQGTGDTTLTAGRHLTADTVHTHEERQTQFHREKETFLAKTSVSGTDHTVESRSVGTQISGSGDVTLSAGFGIAKDGSFAGDEEGAAPLKSSIPAYGTAQNLGQRLMAPILGSRNGSSLGPLTLKNTQITSGGKTTLTSTGTTTFVEDTETHYSQSTRSNVGVLWQKQTDTGDHHDTGAHTTITAAGGSSTTAEGCNAYRKWLGPR